MNKYKCECHPILINFTLVMIGAWVGWGFMWQKHSSYTYTQYSCYNITIVSSTTICDETGCISQTNYELDCATFENVLFKDSGTYQGTQSQTITFITGRLNKEYFINNEPYGLAGATYFVLAYLIVLSIVIIIVWLMNITIENETIQVVIK